MTILKDTEQKMNQSLDFLQNELKQIRTGRANPAMLDSVSAEVYGAPMRLKDIASITIPESRQLLITPFDAQNSAAIGKAIEKANLGFMPIVDGNAVRINIPPMDQSLRQEMVKLCHKKREECKVSIRGVRRDANDAVRRQKSEGEIPEDLMKKHEKKIQELTDQFCKEADTITAKKEEEICTI